ncbi:MAG: putative O-glycosylation ligase, exosortase A system-associated, partial [Propionivibrio sp.]
EDNNGLALALVMLVPFFYYLHQTSVNRWIRWGLIGSIIAIVFSILGSQSRGALLAIIAMAVVLGVKGKHFFKTSFLIAALLVSAISFMPESWTSRMATIQNYDQDASAMSRLYVWQTMWNLAVDRPIVGGGFGTDTPIVFARYAPVSVGDYEGGSVLVAHSIYFQALGEHGFPGLILFMFLGIFAWRKAANLAKQTATDPEFMDWVPLLMRMVQVSIAGFSVGGAFLSVAYFDLPYYIIGYVVLVDATVREREKSILETQADKNRIAPQQPL